MSARDPVVPVGVGLPCAVCGRVPPQIVALCPVCNEAIKARLAHTERMEKTPVEIDRLLAFVARVADDPCRWAAAGFEPCMVQCGSPACISCKASSLLGRHPVRANAQTKAAMALSIAKRAVEEIELALLLGKKVKP